MRAMVAIVALLACGSGGAWAQGGSPADGDLLLDCHVSGHVPEEPGRTDQGGYGFEYQSFHGATEDDRTCTVYRLRNTSGKPPTPFRWTQGDAVVVDKGRLPRCDGACDWLTFVKYFPGEVGAEASELSYGLNADAYRETAETVVGTVGIRDDRGADAVGSTASSVGTEVFGTFAVEGDASVDLHLIAKSRFEPASADGLIRLVYEVEDLTGSGALDAGAVRVVWGALEAHGVGDAWHDAAVATPVHAVSAALERTPNALSLVVEAAAFALDESFVLQVFVPGEDEPVVVVPMPAYVATGDRAPR